MTQVSWNRQLGLAAALLILGTAAYWLEFKHKPQKEDAEQESKKLFVLKETSVQRIQILSGGAHPQVALSCLDQTSKLCKPGDQSKWEITQPSQLRADDSNVNSFLSTLNNLNSSETISLKDETPEKRAALLKEYGLDAEARKSAPRVEVTSAKGTEILVLGTTHPIGQNLFAAKENAPSGSKPSGAMDEQTIYLVPSYFKANLEHELTYWRDKKLLTMGSHEVESFRIQDTKHRLSAVKKDGQWTLQSSEGEFPGDLEQINSLLSSTAYLTAKDFASDSKSDSKAKTALASARLLFTLTLQKEKGTATATPEPVILSFYQKKPKSGPSQAFATVSNLDPVFELNPGPEERLNKSLKELRQSKLMTTMARFGVKRLEFKNRASDPEFTMIQDQNGKWSFAKGNAEIDPSKVQTLLDRLSSSKIKDFFSLQKVGSGLNQGLETILTDEKGKTVGHWVFWRKDQNLYAKDLQTQKNEAILVENTLGEALPWAKDFFKKVTPAPSASPTSKEKKT